MWHHHGSNTPTSPRAVLHHTDTNLCIILHTTVGPSFFYKIWLTLKAKTSFSNLNSLYAHVSVCSVVGSCDRQEDLFVNTTVPYCIVLRTEIKSYVYPIAMTPHGASSIEPSVNVAPTMQGRRKV